MSMGAITSAAAQHRPAYDPDELPDLYAARGAGTCMEPDLHDGVCLAFQRSGVCKPGDFVAIWLRPERVRPGGQHHWLKRLVMAPPSWMRFPYTPAPGSSIEPVIVVEQLNPPKRYVIACADILAMHRCIGEAESLGDGRALAQLPKED